MSSSIALPSDGLAHGLRAALRKLLLGRLSHGAVGSLGDVRQGTPVVVRTPSAEPDTHQRTVISEHTRGHPSADTH